MIRLVQRMIVFLTMVAASPCVAAAPPASVDLFRTQVAPIFQRRCFRCHNRAARKGEFSLQTQKDFEESGFVEAGIPEESYLLDVLLPADGKRAEMPKDGDPLSAADVRVIRDWIKSGAKWPNDFEIHATLVKDSDWWSLRPIVKPDVPAAGKSGRKWIRTPIDAFVLSKLREQGLSPSPEAERRTLIRRLSFDLIGLPPTPAEVATFVDDPDPKAYEKLVDRLLASGRHGERWARHWLDVVQYADTHGYDKDKLRPNAWPYRDYVIRAFNRDKPYGRFVEEQIAGDVLWPGSTDAIVATGFIAAGPWDYVGHAEVPESKIDGQVARNLDRDNIVTSTMNTFCSLTIQCARCHNHKLDPVTMQDYYSLQAVFAAIDRADRRYDSDPQVARHRTLLQSGRRQAAAKRAGFQKQIDALKTPEILKLEKQIATLQTQISTANSKNKLPRSTTYGYHATVAAKQETVKWVQVDLGRPLPIEHVLVFAADEDLWADFGFPHRFKVEVSNDVTFSRPQLIADDTVNDFARPGRAPVHIEPDNVTARYVRMTATKLWNRRKKGQQPTGDWIFAIGELAVLSRGTLVEVQAVTALDSIEDLPRWGRKDLTDGVYGRWTLAQLTGEKKPASVADALLALTRPTELQGRLAGAVERRDALLAKVVGAAMFRRRAELDAAIEDVDSDLKKLPAVQIVYAGTVHDGKGAFRGRLGLGPREIRLLYRGDVTRRGEIVTPGTVPFVPGVASRFELPDGHDESERRVALARWLTHRDNPLTWRSIVNRVWLYHFSRAIVDSPNDFGHGGELPSHPELLDWLAVEFRDGGQSLKKLHRLICLSAVYRQSSVIKPGKPQGEDPAAVDADNRLLWRMNQRRLSAEEIRDTVLCVAGKLDTRMGGPGFMDFRIEHPEHSPHYEYGKYDPNDPKSHRRTIYRFIVRSQPQPFLNTLDCADPSLSVPKRDESITALQALAMLNNRFMIAMSVHFAERLKREAGNLREQLDLGFRLTTGRSPTDTELQQLASYASEFGLANTCRVMLNLNEFIFVD